MAGTVSPRCRQFQSKSNGKPGPCQNIMETWVSDRNRDGFRLFKPRAPSTCMMTSSGHVHKYKGAIVHV